MRNTIVTFLIGLSAAVLAGSYAAASDTTVASDRIQSIGLFKNGLAYVTREIEINRNGESILADIPRPAHGTFFVESPSDIRVDVRVTEREQAASPDAERLLKTLDGATVTVYFNSKELTPVSGTIAMVKANEKQDASRFADDYEDANRRYGWYSSSARFSGQPPPSSSVKRSNYLTVKTEEGPIFLEPALISQVDARAKDGSRAILSGTVLMSALAPTKAKQPVMIFDVDGLRDRKKIKLTVSYLTKGIAWAPSYRIDLAGDSKLTLVQKSIIKNELHDIRDAEFFLITGFPSIEFSSVVSPLSLQTTWMNFFQQLKAAENPSRDAPIMGQQAVLYNSDISYQTSVPTLPVNPSGEGPDLHYESIGLRTLALGDSLTVTLPSARADYHRIVEWIVPDNRDYRGHMQISRNDESSEKWHGVAWDSIRFKNPLNYPMTTGPAMVVQDGKILGQRTSYFVSPGEETTQHITKALSIRTLTSEQEEQSSRQVVFVAGNDYQKTNVNGRLIVKNHRAETIELVIRRRFSGELIEAAQEPQRRLLAEGVYSINQRNELIWTLKLSPGEEKELTYRYSVLVYR
jgi:hypothetical protein